MSEALADDRALERLLARDPHDLERLQPVDALQCELTERYIAPVRGDLEREFLAIREQLDAKFRALTAPADASARAQRARNRLAAYPKGFCLEITHAALAEFGRRALEQPSPASEALARFQSEGGHFNKLWGVLRERYFQNALQIGSLYFDTANDTVDVSKPKVECLDLADSGFRNLSGFEDFARIAERYWECEVYPNRLFPRLAPFFPILRDTGTGLVFESGAYFLQRLNLDSDFEASLAFLRDSAYASRALPDSRVTAVQRYKREHMAEQTLCPDEGVSVAEIESVCKTYRAGPITRSRPLLARILSQAARLEIPLEAGAER